MNRWPWRKLLIVDFAAAFFGAVTYYASFDFLTLILEIPHWIASTQVTASFLYGMFGLMIFISGTRRLIWFKSLIALNCLYASFCAAFSVVSFVGGAAWGALLLAIEALIIFLLAKLEFNSIN